MSVFAFHGNAVDGGTSWFDTNLTMALLTAECVHDFIMPRTHLTPCACIFENQPGQANYLFLH